MHAGLTLLRHAMLPRVAAAGHRKPHPPATRPSAPHAAVPTCRLQAKEDEKAQLVGMCNELMNRIEREGLDL